MDAIAEGLQLVSDMRLRQQAEQRKTQIDAAIDAELKKKLTDKRAALLKNIGNDVLRPA